MAHRSLSTSLRAVMLAATMLMGAQVAAAPAVAKTEEKKVAPIKLGKEVSKIIVEAQKLQKDGKLPEAIAKAREIAAIQGRTPTESFTFGQLLYSLAQAANDQAALKDAVEIMYGSGGAPDDLKPKLIETLRSIAYQQKDLATATRWGQELTVIAPNVPEHYVVLGQLLLQQDKENEAMGYYEKAIAVTTANGGKAEEGLYGSLVNAAVRGGDAARINKTACDLIRAYPTDKNIRAGVVYFRDRSGMGDPLVLASYRLQWQANALQGAADYLEMADTASKRTMFAEAAAAAQRGLDSGAIQGGTVPIAREIINTAKKGQVEDQAALPAQEKQARAAATGDLAAVIGESYYNYGDYQKSIELLNLAIQKGITGKLKAVPNKSQAQLILGTAQTASGQLEAAKATFSDISGANEQALAQLWIAFIDSKSAAQ